MACLNRLAFRGASAIAISLLLVSSAFSQGQGWMPADAQMFEKEGTVAGVVPGGIQMLTERDSAWLVQVVPRQSMVKITGTAEPGFLRPGIFVRFSGEVDEKGVLKDEISEMEIFTPMGKNSMGTFASGADENAKPVGKLTAGSYDFRGKVAVYKDGALTVVAGKKITGKVASDAKIAVNVSDISFAQKDDPLKVKGFYYERFSPAPAQGRVGQAVGKEIEITLANPLAAMPTKGPGKPTKPGKGKPQPDAAPADSDDPFNLGGEKKEAAKPEEKK